MALLDGLKRLIYGPEEPPEPVAAVMVTRPMAANPTEAERIAQAWYRIDAVKRHVAQHDDISAAKRTEFSVELRTRAAWLLERGQMTLDEFDAVQAYARGLV